MPVKAAHTTATPGSALDAKAAATADRAAALAALAAHRDFKAGAVETIEQVAKIESEVSAILTPKSLAILARAALSGAHKVAGHKSVTDWQRARFGMSWGFTPEDRARLAATMIKVASEEGQPVTKADVAELIGVNKSQITRGLQDLIPGSDGVNAFDRRKAEAAHGGARVKRTDVERVAKIAEDLATMLAAILTPTEDNPRPTMSDALAHEVRALRDLCTTALTGSGIIA